SRGDELVDWSSEKCFGVSVDLLEYEGGYLLGSVFFSVDADLVVAAHFSFDFLNRSFGVSSGLPLRRLPNYHLAILCEGDYCGKHLACGSLSLTAWNHQRASSLHYRSRAV